MNNKVLGNLFVVSSPSGGGKTSLIKRLIADMSQITVSISHTTRDQRAGEQHGVNYFFVDENRFKAMVDTDYFIEYAQVFDHFYGTSKTQIIEQLQRGIDVILDIDWQGAMQIKKAFPEMISIFIIPPSLDILEQRLLDRRRDDLVIIQDRMKNAQNELRHFDEFDYLVVNDDFEKAVYELSAIVTAQRLRSVRQAKQQCELLSFLLSSQ